jgi:hypothetical protein
MNEDRELVFLCYSQEDLSKVHKVYEGLIKRRLKVWFDKKDMKGGKWMPQIKQAIARSKYFIVLLSKSAIKKMQEVKGVQKDEFSFAHDLAMNQPEDVFCILPVRLEDCERGDHRLTIYQHYDLFPDFEKGLDKLTVDLGGCSLSDATAKDERTEDEKRDARLMGKAFTASILGCRDVVSSMCDAILKANPHHKIARR